METNRLENIIRYIDIEIPSYNIEELSEDMRFMTEPLPHILRNYSDVLTESEPFPYIIEELLVQIYNEPESIPYIVKPMSELESSDFNSDITIIPILINH